MKPVLSFLAILVSAIVIAGCGYAPYLESDPAGAIVSVNGGQHWPAPLPCNVAIPVDANTKSFTLTVWKGGFLAETRTIERDPNLPEGWPQRISFKLKPDPNLASGQKTDQQPPPAQSTQPPPRQDPKPADPGRRYCTACKAALESDSPFCPKCGMKQPGAQPAMRDCPVCGEKRPIGSAECPHCGVK